ncbi:hypothetical protein A2643_00635 [Candidatus Nomurabacteria bacterium RIFCSPHIGHO2_01_FULL_39_220]|uniref:Uncharacterized protein n=1 Tax=Candidatus Nomurabacteria bacterium RIFCSPLOWO2_02_FULL_40_67 TaxID=1801787 RepID=A0A1F6Y4A3_9BACT|nr:MAG: hypothetical protein UU01_C0002G0044 [Parcubacteria group bacterium GW2011_GWA2_40_37]KKS73428.1 MAG: hypothetical protein UV43_C0001G0007 [Parcubacteria group bacterium GW2011_GWF2_42_7]OGI62064.1 MAG: hypothetical protein A2W12_01770 [Candidatus Nomurabacteria bacterium RBG_16_40_11]OGI70279.1 MAG: hypothetical protein A2643_00635 [Candidatus Nomurabacteria bacterium RIFCSPHIGHO2_01_FULL_39_220]OGI73482.1 MAG: hypothetical protein A2W56_02235 [Candidatus Nomurabacteria bacterium RIFCS
MNNLTGFDYKRVGILLISVLVGYFVVILTAPMFESSGVSGIGGLLGLLCAIVVYKRLTKKEIKS